MLHLLHKSKTQLFSPIAMGTLWSDVIPQREHHLQTPRWNQGETMM